MTPRSRAGSRSAARWGAEARRWWWSRAIARWSAFAGGGARGEAAGLALVRAGRPLPPFPDERAPGAPTALSMGLTRDPAYRPRLMAWVRDRALPHPVRAAAMFALAWSDPAGWPAFDSTIVDPWPDISLEARARFRIQLLLKSEFVPGRVPSGRPRPGEPPWHATLVLLAGHELSVPTGLVVHDEAKLTPAGPMGWYGTSTELPKMRAWCTADALEARELFSWVFADAEGGEVVVGLDRGAQPPSGGPAVICLGPRDSAR